MSTLPSRRAMASKATVDRLLQVARRAFATRGFDAVSLDALAAEAGLTRGALHHHFTNKSGLLRAVLHQMDEEIGARIDAAWDPSLPSWSAWRAAFHHYLDAVLQPECLQLFFVEGPKGLGAQAFDLLLSSGLAELIQGLSDPEVAAVIRPGNAEAMAHALNGAAFNLAFWAARDPDRRRDEAHRMLDLLFDGMQRPIGPPPAKP